MPTIVLAGGSSSRAPMAYNKAAREFGRRVARRGWTLRTGGGSGRCIMGAAADGALEAGGRVEGVILRKFWPIRHRGLDSIKAYKTFALRKEALFRGAEAAVVFPGGYGTLDELGDLLTLRQTDFVRFPIVVADIGGFFREFLAWERRASREKFLYGPRFFSVCSTPAAVVRRIAAYLR